MEIHKYNGLRPDNLITGWYQKKGIVLHHTAGSSVMGAVSQWNNDGIRVATPYIIGGLKNNSPATINEVDGGVYEIFEPKNHWSYALGLKNNATIKCSPTDIERSVIQIELVNWGQLTEKDGKFYHYLNKEVPADQVVELDTPWRGFKFWHKYTDAQIKSLYDLLHELCAEFGITKSVFGGVDNITPAHFLINNHALANTGGIWSHGNYRKDKFDLSPQPELIKMLNSL